MKPADIGDWFALRPHLLRPWAFVRLRHRPSPEPVVELPLRRGGVFRIRTAEHDRHVFKRVFARDDYRLKDFGPGELDTVVDAGAHIGAFALRVAPFARRVLCVEPAPDNLDLLRRNAAAHGTIDVLPFALAGHGGRRALRLGQNGSRHSFLSTPDERGCVEVEAISLETLFTEHQVERCDLLKLDVEGAEYEILRGLPPALWSRVRRVRMEYHPAPGESGEALGRFLEGLGFRVTLAPHKKNAGEGLLFAAR